ncbi:MAG: C5a peptidase [Calditrichaeota bacterium]|nr:C5a peptidase [Calditrichota bacterium]
MIRRTVLLVAAALLAAGSVSAEPRLNVQALQQFADEYTAKWESWRGPEFWEAKQATTGIFGAINADPSMELVGIDADGNPIVAKYRNVDAAITTRTDHVQPGGDAGYDLDGSSTSGLYHWDGSAANPNHQELVGRVTVGDGANWTSNHASHTAGTMIASGVNANAMGMAVDASLTTYDWNNDQSEMAIAATEGAKVSSHSYGFGNLGGEYDQWAAGYDEIQYNAPNYQVMVAGGNAGPSYDSMYDDACAKNIISVGNVQDVLNYDGPGSVNINWSSSLGPTQDGRIKPDIVGNGTELYSCSVNNYTTMTGTSMASPNIAGSLFLLYELYEQTHEGEVPWSSTVKAVMINTADECGDWDGPDYKYGWGLMNTNRAADLIASDEVENPNAIMENVLLDGVIDEFTYTANGDEPVQVTIVWTDPPAQVWANPTLINDLDLRVIDLATGDEYMPWTLNGNNPTQPAEVGDNEVDNVEQVLISDPIPGPYTVQISHEGNLQGGEQAYSLVVQGLTGGEAPEYLLYLTPIWNYISPNGGPLRYDARFRHNRDTVVPGLTYWATLILPNGNEFGPVYEQNFTAGPWMDVTVEIQQMVPGFAPTGAYEYIGQVGFYPDEIVADDSFEMVKFGMPNPDGVQEWSGSGFDVSGAAGDAVSAGRALPAEYALSDAYPNPFNPSTTLEVSLPEAAALTVDVYNIAGRRVATLAQGRHEAGRHTLTFDGANLASGVYFIQADVPGALHQVRKVTLMR